MGDVRSSARLPIVLLTISFCALLLPTLAHAGTQSAVGTIGGGVLDPDGKVIVAAPVLVRNEATNEIHTTATDAAGHFSVPGLVTGSYTIEVAVPGFEIVRRIGVPATANQPEQVSIQLTVANISETVTVSTALPQAAVAGPSQGSLTARSATSLISNEYIRNYTSPISDYSQVLQMAPGTYSVSANGPGLGDTKTFYRGFKDGFYNMSFDGIPFGDTNDPTHHSWVFFPAQTIGSTVFDRSPGSAATIGPSTYGGSVNFLSPSLATEQTLAGTASYGSFNTRLFDVQFDSGRFGGGKSRLMFDAHDMRSDGYQTYNFQRRDAFSAKYQYAASERTILTAFSSVVDLRANTPNQKGATRAQIQQHGDNFLNSGNPNDPLYYKFNFYHVPTNFEYFGIKTDIGHGWSFDDKVYTMRYHNQQNYNGLTSITTTSATDKLNAYWKFGNILPVQYVSAAGVFRSGLWAEYASTNRYQTPSDPRTWIDAALPNFHESFGTTTVQPYGEYEWRATSKLRITPGLKYAYYKQDFTQFADNGKTIGNLNGAPSVQHAVSYTSWLPSIDAHYRLQSYWSVYAQYGKGQNIPPTSYYDVKGALVSIFPKPLLTDTYQVGSVWKSNRATLDVDYYYITFQNGYSSFFNTTTGDSEYYLSGDSVTKGFEAESTILVGGGLAVYLNGTAGSAKYSSTDLRLANAPKDTETIGITYNLGSWNVGFFNKRVGQQWNDNGSNNQAVPTDPFNITNLFVNYTLNGTSKLSRSRIRLAINNLTDSHAITGITPASTKSNAPSPGDVLTLMPGRSVAVQLTVGVSRR